MRITQMHKVLLKILIFVLTFKALHCAIINTVVYYKVKYFNKIKQQFRLGTFSQATTNLRYMVPYRTLFLFDRHNAESARINAQQLLDTWRVAHGMI